MNSQFDTCWPDWKIAEEIGSGTYGHVYKIKREEKSHIYYDAMKVISIPKDTSEVNELINSGMDRENITEYFQDRADNLFREIDTMIQLGGFTNIVTYKDHKLIEHKDGIGYDLYIRMELLTPLSEYLLSHKITTNEVVQMGIDICKALELCEKHNIIHRDIKPANVFLSTHGDFELGDFGVSRTMNATTVGTVAGTYTYMAPEVYLNHAYNNTVDIYSLGMMMYQFLNGGRLPFMPPASEKIKPGDMETALLVRMKGDTPVPEITGISPTLSSVICKACSYESNQRYQSAREFREALQETISGKIPASRNNDVFISPDYIPEVGPTADNKNKLIDEAHADKSVAATIYQSEDEVLQQKSEDKQQKESSPLEPPKKRSVWIFGIAAAAVIVIVAIVIGFSGKGKTISDVEKSETVQAETEEDNDEIYGTSANTDSSQQTTSVLAEPATTQSSETPAQSSTMRGQATSAARSTANNEVVETPSEILFDKYNLLKNVNTQEEVERVFIEKIEEIDHLTETTINISEVHISDVTVSADMLQALLSANFHVERLYFFNCDIKSCTNANVAIEIESICFYPSCTLKDTDWLNSLYSLEYLTFYDSYGNDDYSKIESNVLNISSLNNLISLDCTNLSVDTIEWPRAKNLIDFCVTKEMNEWSRNGRNEQFRLLVAAGEYDDVFDDQFFATIEFNGDEYKEQYYYYPESHDLYLSTYIDPKTKQHVYVR